MVGLRLVVVGLRLVDVTRRPAEQGISRQTISSYYFASMLQLDLEVIQYTVNVRYCVFSFCFGFENVVCLLNIYAAIADSSSSANILMPSE